MPEQPGSRVSATADEATTGEFDERTGLPANACERGECAEPSTNARKVADYENPSASAYELAERAGLSLCRVDGALSLSDGTMRVAGDFTRMIPRLKDAALHRELLVRAARLKGAEHPTAIDATAGLGEDSLLLAAAGFHVTLFERDPVIAALLADALERAAAIPELADTIARMELVAGDSVAGLHALDCAPDLVFLDPMFPAKRGDARAKKKLQLFQRLEAPCNDEEALLDAAFAARPQKVVVKRPVRGPYLAGKKPSYSLTGKTVRYDCHVIPRA